MGSKRKGKAIREAKEFGVYSGPKSCNECEWFSREYPTNYCLKKWKNNPMNSNCKYFRRRHAKIHKATYLDFLRDGVTTKTFVDVDKKEHKLTSGQIKQRREDYAYIINFMPHGHPDDKRPIHKKEPLAQVIGERRFTFLEVSIKKGESPLVLDRVFIGKGEREVIHKIKRKLRYDQLTPNSREKLLEVLPKIVKKNEEIMVQFFNTAYPIHRKLHLLNLLAGMTDNKYNKISKEWKKKEFTSFTDISIRTGLDPIKAIANRVLCEMKNPNLRYKLFKE